MKLTRLAALVAVPVGMSLAACSGGTTAGSTGVGNITGQQAYVRFLNGYPALGSVALAIQAAGTGTPSGNFVTSLPYAEATDFIAEPTTTQTLFVAPAGTAAPAAAPTYNCKLPQLANNVKYDIVLAKAQNTSNCIIFQDQDYTSTPQVRFHDASAAAANTSFDWGTSSTAGTFTVLGNGALGNVATPASGAPTTYSVVTPVNLGGATSQSNVTFAIGAPTATPAASGTTEATVNAFNSQNLLPPNSTTSTNTGGVVNATGTAGTSLFALDCTGGTLPAGAQCVAGTALIGYTDSK